MVKKSFLVVNDIINNSKYSFGCARYRQLHFSLNNFDIQASIKIQKASIPPVSTPAQPTGLLLSANFGELLFLIQSASLSGSLSEICYKALWLLPYPSRALGCAACLLSLGQELLTARALWDDSQELSNSGEIPCLLYLEIKEAKRIVGQRIGGRPLRC